MSTVIDFLKAVQKDPALQEKFVTLVKKHEGRKMVKGDGKKVFEEELIPLARSAGFEISFTEYKAWIEQGKTSELADDELAAVAGGDTDCVYWPDQHYRRDWWDW